MQAWFSPGRGPELSHRIAARIGGARRRVRIASPVLTAAPVLAALNQALSEGVVDAVRARYPAVAVPSYAAD